MCGVLCDCLKGSGKVVCCCCQCAFTICLGILCSVLILFLIIGLIVYFTVFHHKGGDSDKKMIEDMVTAAPLTFKGLFQQYY